MRADVRTVHSTHASQVAYGIYTWQSAKRYRYRHVTCLMCATAGGATPATAAMQCMCALAVSYRPRTSTRCRYRYRHRYRYRTGTQSMLGQVYLGGSESQTN